MIVQESLFNDSVEFKFVKSVIGSGYETKVADLALRDGVAYRAARKNMQIHSAIILEINGEFSGFFTFQINIDYSEYSLKYGGYENLQLDKKIELVNKITGFKQVSVGEYVKSHWEYFRDNVNFNKEDCCNL